AGLILQLDCPDLAMTRVSQFSHLSVDEFKKIVAMHVEVINYALQGIDPERMRLHVCWGNTEGPHHHDVPLREIVHTILQARPLGLSIEGANPRHGHEWKVWEDVSLPEGKVLIPGVLDTTTNFIEHPELIAQRILNYANAVGQRLRLRHLRLGPQGGGQRRLGQAGLNGGRSAAGVPRAVVILQTLSLRAKRGNLVPATVVATATRLQCCYAPRNDNPAARERRCQRGASA
ncbi:MAG: hypothetical protein J4G13_15710, partial [Dehalococcoidia bacterium]|nr:hypothetical protein [Dehalococcoidia bacterium]